MKHGLLSWLISSWWACEARQRRTTGIWRMDEASIRMHFSEDLISCGCFFFAPNSFWLIVMNWRVSWVHFRWTESVPKTCWLKCFSAACAFVVIVARLGACVDTIDSRNILVVLWSLYLSLISFTLPWSLSRWLLLRWLWEKSKRGEEEMRSILLSGNGSPHWLSPHLPPAYRLSDHIVRAS